MANEVLAKIVFFILTCVIHEMYELGIDPGFGGKPQPEPEPDADAPWLIRFPGA
jgi:hypothetical protein